MRLTFTDQAWDEYLSWFEKDRRIANRIHALLKDTLRSPYAGMGKPEPLQEDLSGHWSRRITEEHRLVYRVEGDDLLIAQLRFHY